LNAYAVIERHQGEHPMAERSLFRCTNCGLIYADPDHETIYAFSTKCKIPMCEGMLVTFETKELDGLEDVINEAVKEAKPKERPSMIITVSGGHLSEHAYEGIIEWCKCVASKGDDGEFPVLLLEAKSSEKGIRPRIDIHHLNLGNEIQAKHIHVREINPISGEEVRSGTVDEIRAAFKSKESEVIS
jgi:predicted  nucleic acid-binding Zn-ribbon protein